MCFVQLYSTRSAERNMKCHVVIILTFGNSNNIILKIVRYETGCHSAVHVLVLNLVKYIIRTYLTTYLQVHNFSTWTSKVLTFLSVQSPYLRPEHDLCDQARCPTFAPSS